MAWATLISVRSVVQLYPGPLPPSMLIQALKRLLPEPWRRRAEVFLVDRGFPVRKKTGVRGIDQLGHRGYIGKPAHFEELGILQFEFLLNQGLAPTHVLCDIGCGSLRGGRHFIDYLDSGNYLGLEAEPALVTAGLAYEVRQDLIATKAPEFVFSSRFEFERFSKAPDFALAVSVFSHLNEADILRCLGNLAHRTTGSCRFFASFFEAPEPRPNFKRSHSHLAFYYTRDQMEGFGRQTGWTPLFMGAWGSPSGQPMMRFSISKPGATS